ncbi:MAG TPA: hypothetical protein VKN99_19645 [Polyangia bacterium]|nr:hypothetical protein [Polyangia bacterium]
MRLGTYVALELCALGAATWGVAVGLRRAGSFLLTEARGAISRRSVVVARDSGPLGLFNPPAPEITDQAERTFLGMSDQVLLDRLRHQPVVRIKFNHGGTSISLRLDFADGSRAAFKPAQTNPQSVPRKEVAAYRLDRLLGLGHVSPSAPRRLARSEIIEKLADDSRSMLPRILAETIFDADGRTVGEAQYWIPQIRDTLLEAPAGVAEWSQWLAAQGPPPPPAKRALAEGLSAMIVFDLLQNNSDRFSGGNIVAAPDFHFLYFLDNTFGFQVEPGGHVRCRDALRKVQRFSRRLFEALQVLDGAAIRAELAREPDPPYEILKSDEIEAVVARRNLALEYIDALIAQFGRDKVLVFP